MNPWAIVGLPIAFAVLTALLLWFLVGKKPPFLLKVCLVAGVVWYGLVLFYTPEGILGWPKKDFPDYCVVLSFKVIEPAINAEEAGIYLWAVPKEIEEKGDFLDNWRVFQHTHKNVPRAYRVEYDEEMHKQLSEADAEAKAVNGLVTFKKPKGAKQGEGRPSDSHNYDDDTGWNVLDPQKIFKKGEES